MKRLIGFTMIAALLAAASPIFGGTKEEIMRLQSDILAMQNQIRMLEKTLREQTDGIRSLVAQLNDQAGKSHLLLTRMSAALETQAAGDKTGNQALLQEMRSLSGKFDDSATRLSALAQQIQDMKVQAKPIGNTRLFQTAGGDPGSAPPAESIYNEALNDLIQGNFDLAVEGFTAFIKSNPAHEKADDAQYGIGEAYYNSNKVPQAIAAFTRVINDYSAGNKVGSAFFKRGKAELLLQEKENAAADFKTVIEKFPDAPEANLAITELENLGISLKPAKPAPTRRKPRI